ncbi:Nuclear transport factor 2 [Orbilia ellipsospora]|uniref:Nuclear transport factor 2 n=1 Tax=Orbilia ellipsospora TaxID=2528407 RepID=A0AAV9X5X4_9PEZI
MANYEAVANQFIEFYYNTFDTNRQGLISLYRGTSLLTFESAQTQGDKDIIEKLVSLPFQKVIHKVVTQDAQPMSNGGIVVLVTGGLMVDDSPAPLAYSQIFVLQPDGGSYYVAHDTFKLTYPLV